MNILIELIWECYLNGLISDEWCDLYETAIVVLFYFSNEALC